MTRRCQVTGDRGKYKSLRMRNILRRSANAKPYFFLNEMNKKVLPAIYSAAVWCLFVVLLFFWLYCVTTVTPFTERSEGWSLQSVRVLDQLQQECRFFCRNSSHQCWAYQLIWIMTISTYTTAAWSEMTRQLGSCSVKKRVLAPVVKVLIVIMQISW